VRQTRLPTTNLLHSSSSVSASWFGAPAAAATGGAIVGGTIVGGVITGGAVVGGVIIGGAEDISEAVFILLLLCPVQNERLLEFVQF